MFYTSSFQGRHCKTRINLYLHPKHGKIALGASSEVMVSNKGEFLGAPNGGKLGCLVGWSNVTGSFFFRQKQDG